MRKSAQSFEEQLRNVKLKKSSKPQKDYSSPKTAGYTSQQEIEAYQASVLDVNTEEWLDSLADHTFPTSYVPMQISDATMFINIYERLYANRNPSDISKISWLDNLSVEESERIKLIRSNLQENIDCFMSDKDASHVFVKLSCRSPKDAPMAQTRLKDIYREIMYSDDQPSNDQLEKENQQITCLLKAAFQAMKTKTADEVLDACLRSERVYQDLLLATAVPERFRENWVIRQFVDIPVDMEFRGFVCKHRLTALSQYNYLIYSKKLSENKDFFLKKISDFFHANVKAKLADFIDSYIIDFAVCEGGSKVWVIEINPFLITTDAALFSWEHEKHILEGCGKEIEFRVLERLRPGAKAMLPIGMKELIKEVEG